MLLNELPQDLRTRYADLQQSYSSFQNDLREYQLSTIPRFVSVPRYFVEIGVTPEYDDMLELAELAREYSLRQMKPIKTAVTSLGTLFCFLESVLDDAFDELTSEDEDD